MATAQDARVDPAGRRLVLRGLARAAVSAVVTVALYYVLPFGRRPDARIVLELALAVALLGLLIAWQLRAIVRASYPGIRAIQALATATPLFLDGKDQSVVDHMAGMAPLERLGGPADIAEVVSKWTGVPVTRLMEGELQKLLRLEDVLHQRVIGQDDAVADDDAGVRVALGGVGPGVLRQLRERDLLDFEVGLAGEDFRLAHRGTLKICLNRSSLL